MSIFKSTFKPFVVRQITARQNLLAKKERTVDFSKYVSAKAPWIRMTSFVDYGEQGQETSELAKKYVLMGGTLYKFNSETGKVFMRSGVGGKGASYGGDLGSTQYGIRPMPGITSMTTRSLGAYGSLTEATVKFYAWDVKQLEDLSLLFQRPGYKVLLEWGWSMYIDTSVQGESPKNKTDSKILNTEYNKFSIQNTPFNTIDCFDDSITQDQIYNQLEVNRHKYSGNYDGVLGSIRNFEYELMPNGSYECTTVLMSIGDVIDTIRMNDTVGQAIPSPEQQETSATPEIKSQFELLFDAYSKLSKINNRNLKRNSFITYIDIEIKPEDSAYIDTNVYTNKYEGGITDSDLFDPTSLYKSSQFKNTEQPVPAADSMPLDTRYNHFIQFAYLVHILNTFKNLFSEKNQKQIDIEIPSDPLRPNAISNGLCQASFNSVSINPNVVLIKNSKATVFKNQNNERGFNPNLINAEDNFSLTSIEDYLYGDTNLGIIGNLYINIGKIVSLYKEMSLSGNGYVYLGTFLSKLLSDVSFSLGSINDFDKFVTDNKICIIDKHYTEVPSESNVSSKFKINILGNSTIVRAHKINSKIFPSQATMIAIAAQSRENVASIQTSTYNYLNRKLKDRLFTSVENQQKDILDNNIIAKRNKVNQILILIQFVKDYVLTNKSISVFHDGNISAMNGYLNTLLVEIDGGSDYKGIIPISVDLTVDGLSGLTIGEIFTVDKNVLPKDYKSKSIGFIVTKLSNDVVTNGWTTSIGSQICILDQQELQIASKEKARIILEEITDEISKNIAANILAVKMFNVLAAFASDYFAGGLRLNASGNIKRTLKTVYTSTALREYPIQSGGGSLTDLEFFEYFSNLLKTYEKPDPKQLFYLGYSIDLYNEKVKQLLISPPIIRNVNGETVTRGESLATVGSSTIEAKTFEKLIKNNIFYNQLPDQIRQAFNGEYSKVEGLLKGVLNEKALQNIEANTAFEKVFGGIKPAGVNALIQFDITNPKDVDSITGNIPVPIPLYSGYIIFNESVNKRSGLGNRII